MEWIDALILGIVQGLAEYLPVSSSGHLEIFREILGIELPGDKILQFDIILHAATVCSTIVVLWHVFKKLFLSFITFKRDADYYMVWKILLSCVPIAFVGFVLKDYVEEFFGGSLLLVGVCLIVTAALLAFAHYSDIIIIKRRDKGRVEEKSELKSAESGREINWADAFIIGCAQALAVLPGLSRSGTTIATGIIIGDKRSKVAYFSFLMVIIPILGEALLDLYKLVNQPSQQGDTAIGVECLLIGFFASFIVGCCACKWMIDLVRKGKLVWFSIYCVIMGVICILWQG
ncbi:MAG: undecaprenyl-diphosphate phosphatase [Muribaculaceae bacterium]|nr:undecaprenyl-diphosphate phosphatase [Muribaculaceae bacterium]